MKIRWHSIQLYVLGIFLFAVSAAVSAQTYTNSYGIWSYAENNNGTCVITNYSGSGGAVVVPGTINSLTVVIIGNGVNAVFPNSGLTSAIIPNGVTTIETNAFAFCNSVSEVTIPNSVVNIGDAAFESCSGLTSIIIPDNVTSIGNSVFENCYVLASVTMGNNVGRIGVGAFDDCYDLASLAIPDSVTNIGESAFAGCGLTGVTIPNSVTSIGNGAFEDCVSLTSVTMSTNITSIGANEFAGYPTGDPLTSFIIPERVNNVGDDAFQYCTALTSIIVPNSVTNIGEGAFQYCDNLANATIGDNVTTIGDLAFEFSGLTNVMIPASVTNIGNVAFACCLNMTTITVAEQNAFYSSVGGGLMDKDQTTLIQFPAGLAGAYSIPNGLNTIGAYSFYGSALSSLIIPNSVTTIEGGAFYICGNLSSITIGSGVTNLGGSAFYYCTSIPFNLYFQGNAPGGGYDPFYGENFASMTVYYLFGTSGWGNTFWGVPAVMLNAPTNGSLQVTIDPAGAVTAGAEWQVDGGVFQSSGSVVTNLSVGSHTVSFSAISGWTTPTNVIVSILANSTTTATGTYVAVLQTGSLQVTIMPAAAITAGAQWQVDGGTLQNSGATVANLSVGSHTVSFTTISGWTTPSARNVSVNANSTTTTTGTYVSQVPLPFTWTTNNGAITITGYTGTGGAISIPSTINDIPVTAISFEAFFDKSSLTGIMIPGSVTNIGSYAFFGCLGLTNVTIPASVISIGASPFQDCTSLIAIAVDTGNPSYSSAGGVLFNQNQTILIEYPGGLAGSYSVPGTVTDIEAGAFYICPGLTSVTIPDSVTDIGEEAFADSYNLTAINVSAGNPAYSSTSGVLFNKNQTVLVGYPDGVSGNYSIPGTVASIGEWAFATCDLTDVMIPNSVTNIGELAFYSCDFLANVKMGNNITSIGYGAFLDDFALTSITIPSSVVAIGDYAFEDCTGLKSAYFMGNAPPNDGTVFLSDSKAIVYYLPGTLGWGSTFGGVSAEQWTLPYPLILTSANGNSDLGVNNNQFGFVISWATNLSVVVQAATNLANPVWIPVSTNILVNGTNHFSDSKSANYHNRFYRIISP